MKIGIAGCLGRMGKELVKEVIATEGCELSGGSVRKGSAQEGRSIADLLQLPDVTITTSTDHEKLFSVSDAIIDFTMPETTLQLARIAAEQKKILISGTTGLTEQHKEEIKKCGSNARIVWSSNMSMAVNLLFTLTEQVAAILNDDYDIEIIEMHHRNKVDAPSGTALSLGEAAAAGRKRALNDVIVRARSGIIGARGRGDIGFAVLRGGDVVGDHSVIFAGPAERLEISHKSSNRSIYARGAVHAALWAKNQKPGYYSMQDVLGL